MGRDARDAMYGWAISVALLLQAAAAAPLQNWDIPRNACNDLRK